MNTENEVDALVKQLRERGLLDRAWQVLRRVERAWHVIHRQRIHTERVRYGDVQDVLSALDGRAAPADMTVAELYYRLSCYLDRNSHQNHERRYRAWCAKNERTPFDPYNTVLFRCGETVTVPPGQGGQKWDHEPSTQTRKAWALLRHLSGYDKELYATTRETLALNAISQWEAWQATRKGANHATA